VITGAAQGIGRQAAETLGKEGYRLVLVDRQSCVAVLSSLQAAGMVGTAVTGDLSDEATIAALVETAHDLWTHRRPDQ
jgi:NAD(P)-dependent dehydrogenase (short-subunit alcohol dehydrogenase family)